MEIPIKGTNRRWRIQSDAGFGRTLADVDVVHFLGACEVNAITILNCPPYIREWMAREQAAEG